MNAQHITELAGWVADIVETDGGTVTHVEMSEYADGSYRSVALVTMYDEVNDLEQIYRIVTPTPDTAPAWANDFTEWRVELRIGERWMELEIA